MAMTHERLAVSSGLHSILTNYRFSGSPNLQNPQPTTSLLVKKRHPTFEPDQHDSRSLPSTLLGGDIKSYPHPVPGKRRSQSQKHVL